MNGRSRVTRNVSAYGLRYTTVPPTIVIETVHLLDVLLGTGEDVFRQDDEIGELARLDRALDAALRRSDRRC